MHSCRKFSRAKDVVGLLLGVLLYGCHGGRATVFPKPLPTEPSASLRDLLQRFDYVYPSGSAGSRTAGVISPRFGLPAFSSAAASFPIEVLTRDPQSPLVAALVLPGLDDRSATDCLAAPSGASCIPLLIEQRRMSPIDGTGFTTIESTASAAGVSVGAWDLVVRAGSDPPQRMHRSVWIEQSDPTEMAPLRVIHLSDIHLGKHPSSTDGLVKSLQTTISRVNAEKPDLVVLTGDVVEDGPKEGWMARAHEQLLAISAPLVIISGNHDYAHFPKIRSPEIPPDGFWTFAREFHSRRRFSFSFHGWDFLGFDSGPSVFAVRVLTRGVDEESVVWLCKSVEDAAKRGRKGVVLFSHAPTRTAPIAAPDREVQGLCGHMLDGRQYIEKIIESGADKGLQMVHLSGHTHWLELHELRPKTHPGEDRWQKWPDGNVCGTVHGGALLLNIPSATQVTFHKIARGRRSGFGMLKLDGDKPTVETWLYDRAGNGGKCSAP